MIEVCDPTYFIQWIFPPRKLSSELYEIIYHLPCRNKLYLKSSILILEALRKSWICYNYGKLSFPLTTLTKFV